jgi:MoxR-like ATPase
MVDFGAGPRACIYLAEAGRAFAAMDGRPAVSEEDIRKAATPVLRHRINTNFQAQAEGKSSEDIVRQLLGAVGPREEGKYDRRKR